MTTAPKEPDAMVAPISVEFPLLQDALDKAKQARLAGREAETEAVTEALQAAAIPLVRAYLCSTSNKQQFMAAIEQMIGNMLGITANLVQQGLLHGHNLACDVKCTCDACAKPAKDMH